MHVQLKLDELRGPPKPLAHCDMKVPGQITAVLVTMALMAGVRKGKDLLSGRWLYMCCAPSLLGLCAWHKSSRTD
jgi:hypothetical protein